MSSQFDLRRDGPGVARLAVGLWWRGARWGAGTTVRGAARMGEVAGDPVLAAGVALELGVQLRAYARELLGINELERRVDALIAPADPAPAADNGHRSDNGEVSEAVALRVKGALLLRASAEVDREEHAHPAYARILTELAPDESRILRLLATEGPRPSVDVRSSSLIGVGSELIAAGLNMIGPEAGLHRRDRVSAYLNNLERLGLIWFSREPIDDAVAYQVVEAQPEVLEALRSGARAKTIQRSIVLTPFGRDFCELCLPLDVAEVEALTAELETD